MELSTDFEDKGYTTASIRHSITDSLARSLISTKIQRPRVGRRLVLRPRLVEQLNPPNSLTFILAPAGYGKTTLLSVWLETCRMPIAWLSLDERDDDLAVFVTGLAEALHSVLPAVVDNTLTALSGMTLPPPEVLARTLLNDLVLIHQDVIVVLDDYHVILKRAIHDLLLELVSHPPQALHLVIASRYDPPFPLPSLRARGYVTELRGSDLRFTPEEAGQFLAETMALTLDEHTIAVLATRTEGWPAGLRLAALSLRQQQPLTQLAPDGFGHNLYIMDYLVAEVLSQLPISVQEFLIKCSILDQMCRPLCEAVTGMVDLTFNDQPILEWLERVDFFLAMGAANIGSGLFQGITIDMSLSNTASGEAAGERTQLSSLVSAGVILAVVVFLAPLLRNLPSAVLGGIVLSSILGLFNFEEFKRYYAQRKTDFVLACTALVGVAASDVMTGLMLAVFLSLVMLLYRASRPYIAILGRSANGEFNDLDRHADAHSIPGLVMLRLDAPLYFFNANVARTQILAQTSSDSPPQAILLDLAASADLDIGTTDMLRDLYSDLRTKQIDLLFAQVRGSVHDRMQKTGLLEHIGEDHLYASVAAAVAAFQVRPALGETVKPTLAESA